MKHLHLIFLTLLSFSLLSLTSCGGDDDGAIGVEAGSGKLTASVDGQNWESRDADNGAVYAESQGSHQIQAFHDDGSFIGLTIFGAITSGSTIASSAGAFQAQYKPDFMGSELFSSLVQGGSGTVTFSTFNENKAKGTFQFTGVKANADGTFTLVEVKNGSFDIDL